MFIRKEPKRKKNYSKMWFHFGRIIGEPHLHKIKVKNNESIKIIGIQNLLNPLKIKIVYIFRTYW